MNIFIATSVTKKEREEECKFLTIDSVVFQTLEAVVN